MTLARIGYRLLATHRAQAEAMRPRWNGRMPGRPLGRPSLWRVCLGCGGRSLGWMCAKCAKGANHG